jgi:hypothetical protein
MKSTTVGPVVLVGALGSTFGAVIEEWMATPLPLKPVPMVAD